MGPVGTYQAPHDALCPSCAMSREDRISYGGCPMRFPEHGCPFYDTKRDIASTNTKGDKNERN